MDEGEAARAGARAGDRDAARVELVQLALDCESSAEPADRLVCRLHGIVGDLPAWLGGTPAAGQRKQIETMLSVGACESALVLVAGPEVGFMMSRSPEGVAIASVWISGYSEEQTVTAADPASAMCGALALAAAQAISSMTSRRGATVN